MHYLNLTSPKELVKLLKKYDFNCKKYLGQNFLVDKNIVKKIINLVEINNQTSWKNDHLKKIHSSYGKTPFFGDYKDYFDDLYKKERPPSFG